MQPTGVGWGGVHTLLFQMPMLHNQVWHEELVIRHNGTFAVAAALGSEAGRS